MNEVYAAGDGAHGVRTAAFNLPNDERVISEKGSARIMLKNIQEAKFAAALIPIAARVLAPGAKEDLSFNYFFTHILAHELSHGIGPHQIQVAGRATTPRQELKELYSAIEEAKADVTGLFMLEYLYDHKLMAMDGAAYERSLYTTYLASAFRSVRFGVTEAHGKGMALQFNYFLDKGAFTVNPDGTFAVDVPKMKSAVRDLTHELLTLEAEGNYAGAKKMLDTLAVIRPAMQGALNGLKDRAYRYRSREREQGVSHAPDLSLPCSRGSAACRRIRAGPASDIGAQIRRRDGCGGRGLAGAAGARRRGAAR